MSKQTWCALIWKALFKHQLAFQLIAVGERFWGSEMAQLGLLDVFLTPVAEIGKCRGKALEESGFGSGGTGEADSPVFINYCSSLGSIIIFFFFPDKIR